MSDLKRHNYQVWDRFFDLLHSCDEKMTDAEVDADLKRFGIQMESANRKLHKIVAEYRARSAFAAAKEKRLAIVCSIRDVVAPRIDNIRAGISELIGRAVTGPQRNAYFHKLESAATEADLQSLMDDLQKLDALSSLDDHDEPPTR